MFWVDTRISDKQGVQFAPHIVNCSVIFVLLVNVLLIRQQEIKKPRVELLVHKEYIAILNVPLSKHVEVKQSPLSQEVVAMANQVHE